MMKLNNVELHYITYNLEYNYTLKEIEVNRVDGFTAQNFYAVLAISN